MATNPSKQELETLIAEFQTRITYAFAHFEAESAVCHWLDTLRAIEEVINLVTVDWDDEAFEERLYSFPVSQLAGHGKEFLFLRRQLIARFSETFANRFCNLMVQGSAIAAAFALHGIDAADGFQSIGAMIGYLQSRRRHFVGLLHILPSACRGTKRIGQGDTLNIFLPIVEFSAAPMMGAQYSLMVKLALERLDIPTDARVELAMLNGLCLEPERASIIEMPTTDEGLRMLDAKEFLPPNRLFSAAELRNDILCIEAAYAEFGLRGTDFAMAATLVRRLSMEYIERDFWIQITPVDLTRLMDAVGASQALRAALVCQADTYMQCLSSYAPLVLLKDRYLSTVTLLSRFMYSWRAQILDRNKRFQIRAGFIFEDQVRVELERQSFIVQDIVRINRQEFDVVTTRDGVIWNVQCKNNFISLDRVDSDASSFARYNQMLVRSYERALAKEVKRERLLKEKLSFDVIQHMVVSRFPVVTDNPRIVVFSRIGEFARRADALWSAQTDRH